MAGKFDDADLFETRWQTKLSQSLSSPSSDRPLNLVGQDSDLPRTEVDGASSPVYATVADPQPEAAFARLDVGQLLDDELADLAARSLVSSRSAFIAAANPPLLVNDSPSRAASDNVSAGRPPSSGFTGALGVPPATAAGSPDDADSVGNFEAAVFALLDPSSPNNAPYANDAGPFTTLHDTPIDADITGWIRKARSHSITALWPTNVRTR